MIKKIILLLTCCLPTLLGNAQQIPAHTFITRFAGGMSSTMADPMNEHYKNGNNLWHKTSPIRKD